MTDEIRQRLSKVYELINRGATEGERTAAKKALDRIIEKYNITADQLDNLNRKRYVFKYASNLETVLLAAIMQCMTDNAFEHSGRVTYNRKAVKEIHSDLTYMDWVTIESAYEYFRRHMKKEWQRVCLPELSKCRKANTKRKLRSQLEKLFIDRYLIASKLYREGSLVTIDIDNISAKEFEQRLKLSRIEGGEYNKQVTRGLYLENK